MTLPLQDIRVLDLTMVWAGPYATRQLADFGAEVIKIESIQRTDIRGVVSPPPLDPEHPRRGIYPDGLGFYPGARYGERPYNRHSQFHKQNRNKLGITLDLTQPRGRELCRALGKLSDVLVENYTPRVMAQFGLDWPSLRALNPSLVMLSMPGWGSTGPYANYTAYGTSVEPGAGHSALMGYPGDQPMKSGEAYGDPTAGITGAVAVLTALWHRRRTGQGQYLDLSQHEASTSLIGEHILAYSMNQRQQPRLGNRHPAWAPHNAYACAGEDRWVTIAVRHEADWAALRRVMGDPAWAQDPRYQSAAGRKADEDALDTQIAAWTRTRPAAEIAETLQAAGVPAASALDARELFEDAQLNARGFFEPVDFPEETEPWPLPGVPYKLTATPGAIRRAGPDLGEHNDYILGELLGLSAQERAELTAAKVIGTEPGALLYG